MNFATFVYMFDNTVVGYHSVNVERNEGEINHIVATYALLLNEHIHYDYQYYSLDAAGAMPITDVAPLQGGRIYYVQLCIDDGEEE